MSLSPRRWSWHLHQWKRCHSHWSEWLNELLYNLQFWDLQLLHLRWMLIIAKNSGTTYLNRANLVQIDSPGAWSLSDHVKKYGNENLKAEGWYWRWQKAKAWPLSTASNGNISWLQSSFLLLGINITNSPRTQAGAQFQEPHVVEAFGSNLVEAPIVYDSFTFTPTRRRYPIYKRELYVLVEFVKKYDYLCKHPRHTAIVHTDHKPLTYFLKSDCLNMNDLFGGFSSFQELYNFLWEHFLPGIKWAQLRFSFKKLQLFASKIKALGVTNQVKGLISILEKRIKKIVKWPVSVGQSEVRSFLRVVGITRRCCDASVKIYW